MRFVLLLAFILVPLAEIALLIEVGRHIGILATVAIVVLTAILGTTLLRQQGFAVLQRASQSLQTGRMPLDSVAEGVLLLIAGAFLLAPGLITDTIGFLLLIPPIRRPFAKWVLKRLVESGAVHVSVFTSGEAGGGPFRSGPESRPPDGDDDGPVIEGEFERLDEKTSRKKPPPR